MQGMLSLARNVNGRGPAVRGYGGCERLAVGNWLLRRDDQVGCLLLSPIDLLEGKRKDACTDRDR